MAWRRLRHGLRSWRVLLAVLVLVPLVARAHAHRHESTTPTSCAVCVATHHAPTLASAPVSCPAPAVRAVPLAAVPSTIVLATVVHAHGGRAPPSPLPSRFA
jgi:hypothetical protein